MRSTGAAALAAASFALASLVTVDVASAAPVETAVQLAVPVIAQAKERCGPAALAMVLAWYGADSTAIAGTEAAYDRQWRGALITDLAACARRSGFEARVAPLPDDSLVALLRQGVPPVVLYARGVGPVTRGHYAVVVGWDPERERYALHDGRRRPVWMSRQSLHRQRRSSGFQTLIVRRPA